MHTQSRTLQRLHGSRGLAIAVSVILLIVVAAVDYLTGRDISFALLYLLPISIATWFVNPRAGILFSTIAGVCGLGIGLLGEPRLAVTFWNAGAMFGVYVAFC